MIFLLHWLPVVLSWWAENTASLSSSTTCILLWWWWWWWDARHRPITIRDISDDSDTVDCITSFPFNTTSSSSILFFVLLWALPDKGDLLIDWLKERSNLFYASVFMVFVTNCKSLCVSFSFRMMFSSCLSGSSQIPFTVLVTSSIIHFSWQLILAKPKY